MRLLLGLAALGAAMTAWPAAAEESGMAPSGDEIVVEGKRIDKKEIDQFVGALVNTPGYGQIGRYEFEVCPVAVGLQPHQTDAIAKRIRAVAAAAGAPVAKAGCRPNLLVLITVNPDEFVAALRKKHPGFFRDPIDQPVDIIRSGPTLAWHVEGRLDQDGLPATVVEGGASSYYSSSSMIPSRLVPATRPHFLAGILVLSVESLRGLSTTQVADYATMRLLARTDPARLASSTTPTILTVIDAPQDSLVPTTLTNWDLSYLKALYGSIENRYAGSQRGHMQRLMRDDLLGSKPQN